MVNINYKDIFINNYNDLKSQETLIIIHLNSQDNQISGQDFSVYYETQTVIYYEPLLLLDGKPKNKNSMKYLKDIKYSIINEDEYDAIEDRVKNIRNLVDRLTQKDKMKIPEIKIIFSNIYLNENDLRNHIVFKIYNNIREPIINIIKNPKKVLKEIYDNIYIGKIKRLDSYCIREISKKPGIELIEKAGAKQKILAVEKIENYNTYENRFIKYFCEIFTKKCNYFVKNIIKEKDKTKETESIISEIREIKNNILEILNNPNGIFKKISEIFGTPIPNYVLKKNFNYNKIWNAYVDLINDKKQTIDNLQYLISDN